MPEIDWHSSLSGRSAFVFDSISILFFAMVSVALTWYANRWMPFRWWEFTGSIDPNVLGISRVGGAAFCGLVVFALMMIAHRLDIVDVPRENRIMIAMKFIVISMLSCSALFVYREPSLGVAPMAALSILSLLLLFRMEPTDAMKTTAALILVSIPILRTLAMV